ncbi:MAG: mechanosensitive ion channel [Burkholderiales bacterium]|nr:mechanosensitive ion channel [Burkholderiales bacterium]
MLDFIFIKQSNVETLFNTYGILQVCLIALTLFLSKFIGAKLLNKVFGSWQGLAHFAQEAISKITSRSVFVVLMLLDSIVFGILIHPPILLGSFLILGIVLLLIRTIAVIFTYAIRNQTHQTFFYNGIYLSLISVFFISACNLNHLLVDKFNKFTFQIGNSRISGWEVVSDAFIITVTCLMMSSIMFTLNDMIKQMSGADKDTIKLMLRLNKLLVSLITIFIVLPEVGINLTALSVFGGAIGIGVGFGLQKIVSNFLSAFIILLDKSVKIGDRIVINNLTGNVSKITIRYVVIKCLDDTEVLIPNEKFMTEAIINHTYSSSDFGLELTVGVGYQVDLRQAIQLIRDAIKKTPNINHERESIIYVREFAESAINIFIRVWPNDSLRNSNPVRNELHIEIIESFKRNNIEIPFPKLDVYLK